MEFNKYRAVFKASYRKDGKDLEQAVLDIKKAGASQIETINVLMAEMGLSLLEADRKVLESAAWRQEKGPTEDFRDGFGDFLQQR